jgi:hypothetical protein
LGTRRRLESLKLTLIRPNFSLKRSDSQCIERKEQTPWPESANELYRPSDRRLSAKSVPTFADRGCCVVSTTDPTTVFSVF